jgi:hypothetical protein
VSPEELYFLKIKISYVDKEAYIEKVSTAFPAVINALKPAIHDLIAVKKKIF